SPQLAVLPFELLEPLTVARRHSPSSALVRLRSTHPAAQGLCCAPNLRRDRTDRRPLRRVFTLVLEYHAHRAFADFGRIPCRLLHSSILSRNGASGKAGPVQGSVFLSSSFSMVSWPTLRSRAAIRASYSSKEAAIAASSLNSPASYFVSH